MDGLPAGAVSGGALGAWRGVGTPSGPSRARDGRSARRPGGGRLERGLRSVTITSVVEPARTAGNEPEGMELRTVRGRSPGGQVGRGGSERRPGAIVRGAGWV